MTSEQDSSPHAHVKECAERIAAKLENKETPAEVRRILVAYLSDLGAKYLRCPAVVRVAYEVICLQISRPPFTPQLGNGRTLEDLLSDDPARVAAAVANITGAQDVAPRAEPLDVGSLALRACAAEQSADEEDEGRIMALMALVAALVDEPRHSERDMMEYEIARALYPHTLAADAGTRAFREQARHAPKESNIEV